MTKPGRFHRLLAAALLAGLFAPLLTAQRTGYSPEEFVRRRAALMGAGQGRRDHPLR